MTKMTTQDSGELALYDPDKGLKTIASAQAIEKHAARIKDPEALFKAIKIRLTAIREFVLWWDGLAKQLAKGGGDQKSKNRRDSTVTPIAGHDGLPDRKEIQRWRERTKDAGDYQRALEDAQMRCDRISRLKNAGTVRGTEGTGEFERYTPAIYIEAARLVLGAIDLDPATSEQAQLLVRATKFFTEKTDGLKQEWHGRVWLNPPYHRELAPLFIDKLIGEITARHVSAAIVLTNNSTDTEWFAQAEAACAAMCFTKGRIKFTEPNGKEVLPTQGQTFFYFGNDVPGFASVFCRFGFGVRPDWLFDVGSVASESTDASCWDSSTVG